MRGVWAVLAVSILLEVSTAQELAVSITVSYEPPPGTELGPNQYRAASGPVTVTCIAVGGTGPVSYQWSSTCRNCPFQTATSNSVTRSAVHSGDTGIYTCTATSGSLSGSETISFNVVGAGIQVFRGASTGDLQVPGSLPNNGIVISLNKTENGVYFRFFCRSDSMMSNVGMLIGPDGTNITTGDIFDIASPQRGELTVENKLSQNVLTASDQGVYTCQIPLQSRETRNINVGVYPSGFNTPPTITSVTRGFMSSTLICTSTGSPATNVTWMRNGQPLTIDGNLYQLTQSVVNRSQSTYENVLTTPDSDSDGCSYTCTVTNALGNDSQTYWPAPSLGVLGELSCGDAAEGTCYIASYAVQQDNSVTFTVSARTPGNTWVGLGVSDDRFMADSDIVFGAADGTNSFIHDRFAFAQAEPPVDDSQDIVRASAEHVDGITTITFNRPRNASDNLDISLNPPQCRFFLFAYSGRVNFFATPPIGIYHGFGPTRRAASAERICIPTFMECSADIDECASNPCQNGGTCIDGVDSSTCDCVAGYTGELCETDIDECAPNPCQNGGACTDGVDTFTCDCVAGYTGELCETDIDECAPNPCQNGGTCTDGVDAFTCNCTVGYTGAICDVAVLCSDPPNIQNGAMTSTGNRVGDTATYTCNSGFERIGNPTTRCTLLSGKDAAAFPPVPPPSCRPLCSDPPTIANGMREFTGNSAGDTATYSCIPDFDLVGNPTTTCTVMADGNSAAFPPPPECSRQLAVSITVSYEPPPGAELGLNQYRAASGPVNVTCTAVGGTGRVSYKWSSTCRNCPFNTANSSSVIRLAVHSGDTGDHTCTATSGSISGSETIIFNVVGAGIHVFRGASTGDLQVPGSLPNNGIVISLNTVEGGVYFHFFCRSDSMMSNVGMLIGPNESAVTTGDIFTIARPQPGELTVENKLSQNVLTANDQGVYTCRIPLQSGEMKDINVGIYPSGFSTPPSITHLWFTYGPTSSNLTCISTGSPATNVIWMRDGQPLILNGSTYQLTQTVADRRLSTYKNVLIINRATSDIIGNTYNCTIINALGKVSRTLVAYPPPIVTISPPEIAIAGESFSLTCTVTLAEGDSLIGDPAVQWMGPDSVSINSDTPQVMTSDSTVTYVSTLEFTPVQTSHGGQYTCQATSTSRTSMDVKILTVQIPPPTLAMSRDPDANVILHNGDSLTLTCTIQLDPAVVDSNVVVTGNLGGPGGRSTTIMPVMDSAGVYRITLHISSLWATLSDTYTCNATVRPGPGVVNVVSSRESHSSLDITIELAVSITVLYVPPPGTALGPNQFRAASGPVTVTCTAVGGTGPVSYQWSSTCRNCSFQTANSNSVTRVAVHSGDTGVHTCTATSGSISGNKTVIFDVVGAGIHVFRGASTDDLQVRGSLPDNGIVISLNTTEDGIYFRFFCRSDSMMSNVGMLIGLDGTTLTTGDVFAITHPQPGELTVENTLSQNVLTASDQGVYTCRIPLQSGKKRNIEMRDINVGIYPSRFNTPPNITRLGFNYSPISSTLTCISTGSPATNVTWMRDGQPLTLNGSTYQLTQTVTDRKLSTYENVLIINHATSDIIGNTYNCTVINALGKVSRTLIAYPPPAVTISPPVMLIAGKLSSLTCTVTLAEGDSLIGDPAVQWIGPDGFSINSDIQQVMTNDSTLNYVSTLEFTPVQTSHGGQYTCQATSTSGTSMDDMILTVQIPPPTLAMSRDPNATVTLHHGDSLTLTCTIQLDPAVVDSDVVVTGNLGGPGGSSTTIMPVMDSAEVYRITLSIPSLLATLSSTYTCNATVMPGTGVMNVLGSESYSSLDITVGSGSSSSNAGAVGGAIAGVLIAMLIVIIIVTALCLFYRQKRHGKYDLRPQAMWPATTDSLELTFNEKDEVENIKEICFSVQSKSEGISVAWFSAHVSNMHADKDRDFQSEYESLKKEPLASYDASMTPCNKSRNRFRNIYPYDFCRVKLKEIEGIQGSDYINASFIEGYTKHNEYIASQAPVPGTVGDFWRMVWEHKLTTIAMLTRCIEEGKKKCEQYWPKTMNETEEVGYNLTVTLTSLLPFAEYEIRTFFVKDTSNPAEPALEVTHFFYQAWPDHGVPSNAMSLINFIERVRKSHPSSQPQPLLVHCSAGVGRTGTFIVVDMEMQRIKDTGVVNVFGCLEKLRCQRVQMVQTLAQYVFIHNALDELITCGKTDISAANLRITTSQLQQTASDKQVSGFQDQYELLQQVSPKMEIQDFSDAMAEYNLSKNRYASRVAGNYCRVFLRQTGVEGSDYINANFVDGYRKRRAYIATQGPLASTAKDFWRMIWEYQSKCIVMLCSFLEEGKESCYIYWPTKQGLTTKYREVEVTLKSEEKYHAYVVRTFEVFEGKSKSIAATRGTSPFTMTLFQLLGWPRHGRPSPSTLLEVVENINRVQMSTGNKPITVMCNDGIGRTGAFICLHAQIEKLKTEGVIDCFQFIKSARLNRPGLVQSVEQYILCHEVLNEFVDNFETYSNFQEVV